MHAATSVMVYSSTDKILRCELSLLHKKHVRRRGAGDGTVVLVVLGTISIDMGSRTVGRVTIQVPHVLFEICFPLAGKGKKEEGRMEGMRKEGQVGSGLSWHLFHFLFLFLGFFSCVFLSLLLPPSLLSYVNSPFPPCRVSLFWVSVALLRKSRHLPYSSP